MLVLPFIETTLLLIISSGLYTSASASASLVSIASLSTGSLPAESVVALISALFGASTPDAEPGALVVTFALNCTNRVSLFAPLAPPSSSVACMVAFKSHFTPELPEGVEDADGSDVLVHEEGTEPFVGAYSEVLLTISKPAGSVSNTSVLYMSRLPLFSTFIL